VDIEGTARTLVESLTEDQRAALARHGVLRPGGEIAYDPEPDIDNCAWITGGDVCSTVRLLAAPYADRNNFPPELRPDELRGSEQ
jgi:hypothetical protein